MPRTTREQLACSLTLMLVDDATWDEQIAVIVDVLDGPAYPDVPNLLPRLFTTNERSVR